MNKLGGPREWTGLQGEGHQAYGVEKQRGGGDLDPLGSLPY